MSFAESLVRKFHDRFTKATTHAFTTELCKGTLSDDRLLVYLFQDLRFFQFGLRLTCKTASLCDDDAVQIKLSKQIGFFANDENDYFQICIDQLSKNLEKEQLEKIKNVKVHAADRYVEYLRYLLEGNHTYPVLITATYLMEEVYLKWAQDAIDNKIIPHDLEWKYKEWIDLHSGPIFTPWVELLRSEVDRVGDESVERVFKEMCDLEYEFFDGCYNYAK